jgi:hypothetical protein
MFGPSILVRTLSKPVKFGTKSATLWQYHPRGDRHSKVACWAILFDLLKTSMLLREQAAAGRVVFGINHEMRDFKQDRKKNLDLVISTPGTDAEAGELGDISTRMEEYGIELTAAERDSVGGIPRIKEGPEGSVHVALEAKACFTEHVKSLPRLHDELNSSHLTIHGNAGVVIAVGLVLVNMASTYLSPRGSGLCPKCGADLSKGVLVKHRQPDVTERVVQKVKQLPRRSDATGEGFDALATIVINCPNDGTPIELVEGPPAPQPGGIDHYDAMIRRVAQAYETRFARV